MTQHYGQHPICAACDAVAKANTDAAREQAAERSARSTAARALATELKLPQRIIDRAASYATDGGTPEAAVERAIIADPDYTPTLQQALRHPDAFVAGMKEV